MPGIMVKNPEKVFTIMNKITIFLVFVFGGLYSCTDSRTVTQNIQTGPVSIFIDLNLSSYMHLNNPGEFQYFDGGIKGVIVIHDYDDQWYAFERTCAFEPSKACSKIWIDSMNIQMKCGEYVGNKFNKCCESQYNFPGFPTKGPAAGRLAQYKIQKDGNILQVYN